MYKSKCSGKVHMIKLGLLPSGQCLVVSKGFKILAEVPFSYLIVVLKLLLIKHSAVYVLMQRYLSFSTCPSHLLFTQAFNSSDIF